MKKSVFFTIFLISLLTMTNTVLAEVCHEIQYFTQHNPDSFSCEGPGEWSVVNSCARIFDNNWNTDGSAARKGEEVNVYFNYTKPAGAIRVETKWDQQIGSSGYRSKLTIPAECWDRDPNVLMLRGKSYYTPSGNPNEGYWYCLADSWVIMYSNIQDLVALSLFEESMEWGICIPPATTTTTTINQTYIDRIETLEAEVDALKTWKTWVESMIALIQSMLAPLETRLGALENYTYGNATTSSTTSTTTSTTTTTTSTMTTTSTTIAFCLESNSKCSMQDGLLNCGEVMSGCLNGADWKYFRVNDSASKETTVMLTHSGDGCNMNDLFIYNNACSNKYKSYKNQWAETWTGTLTSDVIVGIDGDTTNEKCMWTLNVTC